MAEAAAAVEAAAAAEVAVEAEAAAEAEAAEAAAEAEAVEAEAAEAAEAEEAAEAAAPPVVIVSDQLVMLPTSIPASSTTYSDQVPFGIAAVEGREGDVAARRRRRSRERVAGLVVRRLVAPRACELVESGSTSGASSSIVRLQLTTSFDAARVGHEDRVLPVRRDEQHVDVVRIRVAEPVEL